MKHTNLYYYFVYCNILATLISFVEVFCCFKKYPGGMQEESFQGALRLRADEQCKRNTGMFAEGA